MGDKQRYMREQALAVAAELAADLVPVTTRLCVAGSLRRGKAEVGDVEILFIPILQDVPADLFGGTVSRDLAAAAINSLVDRGVLGKRLSVDGHPSWGARNKLAVHVASGIPVDLFSTDEESWWNYLVCRTGSAATNQRICMAAQARGWKWNPYGPGFSRGGPLAGEREIVAVSSEQEVFEFVGLAYQPPERR